MLITEARGLLYYLVCLSIFSQVVGQNQDAKQQILLEDVDVSPSSSSMKHDAQKKDLNCDNFSEYALNCTMNAAIMYNSNRKSPPMPKKLGEWCSAVKYLTSCALDWNTDCREFTDSHFNEESINGHSYVVHNICNDKGFLEQYADLSVCVDYTADPWEVCYTTFKNLVDSYKKNTSADWTHFETHFYLCCGRATFRRCVLETVFKRSDVCTRTQAITLQKFSVIVSEGDVYQDCEFNMLYKNCPGGDPRPWNNNLGLGQLNELRTDEPLASDSSSPKLNNVLFVWLIIIQFL